MRIVSNLLFLGLISLSLASCSTLPSTFSTENIMKIHQGMSSDEILTLFGEPQSISVSVCGSPGCRHTTQPRAVRQLGRESFRSVDRVDAHLEGLGTAISKARRRDLHVFHRHGSDVRRRLPSG